MNDQIVTPPANQSESQPIATPNQSDLNYAAFVVGVLMSEGCINVAPEWMLDAASNEWSIAMRIVSVCLAHHRQQIESSPGMMVNAPFTLPFGMTR